MIEISNKKLLWGLSFLTLLFLFLIGIILYLIPYRGLEGIYPFLPSLLLIIIGGLLGFTVFNLFSLVIGVTRGKGIAHAEGLRKTFFKFFYPIMSSSGRLLGISKEKTHEIFIDVNNLLIRSNPRYVKPERLLALLPHCLQFNECDIRITGNVYRCAGCGRCEIKDLAEMAKKANIHLSVATGGSLARRIVEEKSPEAIIAVACERELVSGIIDSYPLPVLGIINLKPYGPCFNTMVDLDEVKDALRYFTGL
jgi:hypothetical protein